MRRLYALSVGGSSELQTMVNRIVQALNDLADVPLLSCELHEDVAITTSGTVIDHKLGRKAKFLIVDKNATCDIWRETSTEKVKYQLRLRASVNVTVSLLLF